MQIEDYLFFLRRYYKSHGKDNIVYFDESGFEKHSYRPHGWALRGQKIYGDVSGNKSKNPLLSLKNVDNSQENLLNNSL